MDLQRAARERFAVFADSDRARVLALSTGIVLAAAVVGAAGAAIARPAPESFSGLVKEVSPAVVNIAVSKAVEAPGPGDEGAAPEVPFGPDHPYREFFERFFGQEGPGFPFRRPMPEHGGRAVSGLGSGFIIDAEGYVVTNNHVIADADEITVTLSSGETLDATLVGGDVRTDLALLKVETDDALPIVSFGDSDAMLPGDWVVAVGNPFGLGGTVTAGIVSARGRDLAGGSLIDFLQIDAPINRGNSGGPTFNTDGEVIGVNTAIFSPSGGSVGIGFAIPSNLAETVIADLRDDGVVERGWLGVRIQEVTPDIAEGFGLDKARGALVASVEPNSPALAAGLASGDVILTWDSKAVERMRALPRLVAGTGIGERVEVEIWRNGTAETVVVTTGEMPAADKLAAASPKPKGEADRSELGDTGVVVADLTPKLRERYDIADAETGVVIVDIASGSPAVGQGLREGDLILRIADSDVVTAGEAVQTIERLAEAGQAVVTLRASRQGVVSFFALRLKDA